MKKEFWKGAAAGMAAAVFISGGIFAGIYGGDSVMSDIRYAWKFRELESLIQKAYLEKPDKKELAEGVYTGLLYGLGDPYSCYYTEEAYKEQNTSSEGAYTGVGIVMQKNQEGGVKVVTCYEGSPAKEAGIREGDIISAVDGKDVTEWEISELASYIKDGKRDSVQFTVHRENVEEKLELTVAITNVELPSVFSEMLEDQVGYIRITEFKGVTFEQYKKAFETLEKAGMNRLVIDLRDNPGGLLTSVCDILGRILPEGLIVYTEDKYGNREEQKCDGKHPLEIPLAVLVNEGSASASEIFAGAVQDYGVGTVVGTRTFGKGIVQAIYSLQDNSAVKLTVSRYYTPKGRNIHQEGIEPDVTEKLDPSLLNKEEFTKEEDNQLQKALEILKETEGN